MTFTKTRDYLYSRSTGDLVLTGLFSFLLLAFAFYNKYPFITSDTGVYFDGIFTHEVPTDRPRFYSDFMKLFFFRQSTWPIVLVQSGITVWLILQVMNSMRMSRVTTKLVVLVYLAVCTQASWYTAQLMPDFTAAVMMLLLMLYYQCAQGWRSILICIGLVLMGIMHNTNFLVLAVLALIVLGAGLFSTSMRKLRGRAVLLLGLAILMQLTVAYRQYLYSGRFDTAPAKHVFLISKLQNDGVLQSYLADECPEHPQPLCRYQSEIETMAGQQFLWGSGIHDSLGGVDGTRVYYGEVLREVYSLPRYLSQIIRADISAFGHLILAYRVGDGIWPYLEGTNPYWRFRDRLSPEKFQYYLQSRQNQNFWGGVFDDINRYYLVCMVVVLILFLVRIRFIRSRASRLLHLFYIAVAYWLVNGIICAILNISPDRLNSRVIWVLMVLLVLMLISSSRRVFRSR